MCGGSVWYFLLGQDVAPPEDSCQSPATLHPRQIGSGHQVNADPSTRLCDVSVCFSSFKNVFGASNTTIRMQTLKWAYQDEYGQGY